MSFNIDDTIVAISTAIGESAIGIVRLSGKDAIPLSDKVFLSPKGKSLFDMPSHTVVYGFVVNKETQQRIDEALFTVMRAPNTYTKQDVVEINCHGGIIPLTNTLDLLLKLGARLAEPGEFTKRAFLNGRIDLLQAEAVIDLIRAKTALSEKVALNQLQGILSGELRGVIERLKLLCAKIEASINFPDEDIDFIGNEEILSELKFSVDSLQKLSNTYYSGRYFREGVKVAIVGKPNVGKSSLLNCLLQKDRAIVTEYPGTTRDIIEDYLNIKGLPVKIIDTAGIRDSEDLIEREGIKRTLKAIEDADLIIALLDCSKPIEEIDKKIIGKLSDKNLIIMINKIDILSESFNIEDLRVDCQNILEASVLKGIGIEELKDKIYLLCTNSIDIDAMNGYIICNLRQKNSIDKAILSLREAVELVNRPPSNEIVATLIWDALNALSELTGSVTTNDILDSIFNEFCIGK
ncbi:MAG: tRNA uridine-5-carboxymethylaminomethyl(34) synthesis GTPase MnmE [Thermodesulfovibrionales bacterium]|nr:tRNA uridine-5-carboxymethylaminomethyl(34) synthesis GTPase MnmE [Thermodesulfovibrionales bacterium]